MNYFAYAANLNRKLMSERCPGHQARFCATLPNYKLIFAGYSRFWKGGVASIKPFRGERVAGAIYDISEIEFNKLDKFEDFPNTYNKINITVWTDTEEPVEAVTYIKKDQTPENKPSAAYLTIIRQGYKDWQIE